MMQVDDNKDDDLQHQRDRVKFLLNQKLVCPDYGLLGLKVHLS